MHYTTLNRHIWMWYMSETGVTETITRFTYVTYVYETCHIRIYTNTLILQICTQTTNIYFIRLYCQLRHSVLVNNARARTRLFLCVNPFTVRKITNLRLFNEIPEAFLVYICRLETFKKNATSSVGNLNSHVFVNIIKEQLLLFFSSMNHKWIF